MRVLKRNSTYEDVSFDKITKRLHHLSNGLRLDVTKISQFICTSVYDGIETRELDDISANYCASVSIEHPDYAVLASRLVVDNNHKNTGGFNDCITKLFNTGLVKKELLDVITENPELENYIDYNRDYLIDYFGFKTLERSYLIKIKDVVIERPQQMWMRVAIGIHGDNIEKVKMTYDLMSQKYFTHATPTLFNAGTKFGSLSSCFLLGMEDSLEGIFKCVTDSAKISKQAGGIGIHCSNIRGKGSDIRGTNGKSSGILPMLKTFNSVARYINQGGKRNGSIAVYLEPWHTDVFEFLEAKKNIGSDEERARDLFYALWIPDLFMKRVENNEMWSLMCPDQCPGLNEVYSSEFEELYTKYENEKQFVKQVSARSIWDKIIEAQIETGIPYILYKDACNEKSNQKNIGTIKSSNLCAEIVEFSDSKDYSNCNLASIALPNYVLNNEFDFEKFEKVIDVMVENLNLIIDDCLPVI